MHEKYIPYRDQVASLQLLAGKAALAGSPTVKMVYEEAVRELLLIITAVRNQLDFAGESLNVSYSGGLFKAGDLVMPYFSKEIEKIGGKLFYPRFSPMEGSVLLAFQRFCPEGTNKIIELFEEKNNL
jgi:N-acetylglucosamine kinase-like BadF-type ATPase